MSPEQTIHDAVVKVCKEIDDKQEEVFGCPDCTGDFWSNEDLSGLTFVECPTCKREDAIAVKEILGSPITLAMILRTIRNIERPLPGAMTDTWWNKQERKILDLWDLEHDTLEAQSPQCKQFVGELLAG